MPAALVVLLVCSLIALLLPRPWSDKLVNIAQILTPFRDGASLAARSVSEGLSADAATVPRAEYDAIARRNEAAEHRTAALALRVEDLEREVAILSATRLWEAGGGRIGAKGRLIPARVITDDLVSWRSSRLVSAGSVHGASRGDAVMSCLFTVDKEEQAGLQNGLAILLGEVFVGFVERTATHESYVKLLSDVTVEHKVRIGRFTGDGFVAVDRYFWLVGRGRGRMEIRDVEASDVEEGAVQVGDVVLSDPLSEVLPAAMTIGRVLSIAPDRDNPLLAILSVEGAISEESLRRVYIYDPDS